ncbi:MAG: efflux RND transporter periplasmic adaptor subunit [Anaerolineales bacterium]|nr:efflux RND transporter periplasmic adaptor subunit [Anaerolineales bacterium]
MKFFKNRFNLIVSGLVLIALIAGIAFYFQNSANAAKTESPAVQTAKVRKGDLVITASGAGVVEPAAQVDLAFRSAGVLAELNVNVGGQVKSAQVLARFEENIQAEADFQSLFTAQGIANAELARANAQANLDSAIGTYAYVIGADAWYWEGRLTSAEAALGALDSSATQSQKDEAQKLADDARARRDYFLSLRSNISDVDMTGARASLESAKVNLQDAQTALDIIHAGPSALTSPLAVIGAQTSKLEQSRLAVENTRLTAPFDGTAVAVNVVKGQTVNTSPVMTIATTNDLIAHVYLDETDLDKVAVGKRVTITFDAYPNAPVESEIILVEPALQSVDGSPVVAAWASLPADANLMILSGMNLEAEVIAGEARDAIIIPKQALRELEPGVFAVFIVGADGQLILTPVEVGLVDYANAEILSGLKVGDVVSTGNVETK